MEAVGRMEASSQQYVWHRQEGLASKSSNEDIDLDQKKGPLLTSDIH